MNKDNYGGDYYRHIFKNFVDYLVVTFFLEQDEEPPEESDLFEYILTEGREREFIDFLVLNVHRLVFEENYQDEMKTTFSLHLNQIGNKKSGTN